MCYLVLQISPRPNETSMNPYYGPNHIGDLPKANLAGRQIHSKYSDSKCPFCRATSVTGHEAHYLLACPSVTPAIEPMYKPIKENLTRLALPPWDSLLERCSSHVPQANPRKGLLQRCVYHEPRTSHGHTHASVSLLYYPHTPQLRSTRYILPHAEHDMTSPRSFRPRVPHKYPTKIPFLKIS